MLFIVLTRGEKYRVYECYSPTNAMISMVDAYRDIERDKFDFMDVMPAKDWREAAMTARRLHAG